MKSLIRYALVASSALLARCVGQQMHETSSSVVQFLYPDGAPSSVQEGPVNLTLPVRVGIAFGGAVIGAGNGLNKCAIFSGSLNETDQHQIPEKIASHS